MCRLQFPATAKNCEFFSSHAVFDAYIEVDPVGFNCKMQERQYGSVARCQVWMCGHLYLYDGMVPWLGARCGCVANFTCTTVWFRGSVPGVDVRPSLPVRRYGSVARCQVWMCDQLYLYDGMVPWLGARCGCAVARC